MAQLDRLFSALGFTQKKADGQVRWAVLSVAALLRRLAPLHDRVAAMMAEGRSVGACVEAIEAALAAGGGGDGGGLSDVLLADDEAGASAAAFVGSTSSSSATATATTTTATASEQE